MTSSDTSPTTTTICSLEVGTTSYVPHEKQTAIPYNFSRWTFLAIGCVIASLLGPLTVNWGQLQALLEKEGAYKWVCDASDATKVIEGNTCKAQQAVLGNIGIISQCLFFVGSLTGGLVIDQYGPRIAFAIGACGFTVSYLLLGLSSETRRTYKAFAVTQGLSVEFCYFSVVTIPNLFPRHRALVVSLLGASRSGALLLSALFNHVRTDQFTANSMGYMMMGVCFGVLAAGTSLLPDRVFLVTDFNGRLLESAKKPSREDYKKWAVTIGQPYYVCWFISYALIYARTQFHIISLSTQHSEVANVFGYLAGLSFIPCPFLGALVDWLGAVPVVFSLNVLGTVAYACLISGASLPAQWIAVSCLTIVLSYLASQTYVIIQERYCGRLVGKLCGWIFSMGRVFSFTNLAMWTWAKLNDQSKTADAIFLGYCGITTILLLVMWWEAPCLFVNPFFPNHPNALLPSKVTLKQISLGSSLDLEPTRPLILLEKESRDLA